MLQVKEIEKKFTQIDQDIGVASRACLSSSDASPQLKESLKKLDQQSYQMKRAVLATDQERIIRTVDELELLGSQAEKACIRDSHVTASLKESVEKVHRGLFELKKQLH